MLQSLNGHTSLAGYRVALLAPRVGARSACGDQDNMELTVTQLASHVACIQPKGRLDAPGADAIGVQFTAAVAGSAGKVAIDLSAVTFLASMGIRLLISNARTVALKGGKVVLFGAGPLVQEVLNDSALDQIMPIVSTQDEAMALLAD